MIRGMEKVGFTTTVPVEVILAAGKVPVDINNVFIASPAAASIVERAESEGLPRTTCGWIKGLYVAAKDAGISTVVAVTQGDCSNTHALMELWQADGVRTIPFAFPFDRDRDLLKLQISKLAEALGAPDGAVKDSFESLKPVREKLRRLDKLTWSEARVSGAENHRWLVSSSDFEGDPAGFEIRLDAFMAAAGKRKPLFGGDTVRLGAIGVPPIFTDFHDTVESTGAAVVYNEVQRQFSMPYDTGDMLEQYARYTYPYDVFGRIDDIAEQARLRRLDGIIHYCQSFCFRAIEDLLIRKGINLPVLTIEGDRPGPVDARTRIRLEGFVEMLRDSRKG
jgi:benzoyl-CoA reductase/2-hydroxyglutaryl-CoA dehydratase subunit BcrC/BadD/HgdB